MSVLPAQGHINVTVEDANQMINSNPDLVVIDVRGQSDYCDGHVPPALNYPWPGVFQARYTELGVEEVILVVCKSGSRSRVNRLHRDNAVGH